MGIALSTDMDPSRTLRGFCADDEEKTSVVPVTPYMQDVAPGAVAPDGDWPDARTVVARAGRTPLPPSYVPAPQPVSGEATRILDVSGMHEWISSAASVSEFAQGTASEFDRASGQRAPRAESPIPELFVLPPEIAADGDREPGRLPGILRAVAVGLGALALVIGITALVKPGLLHQARASVFPEPVAEPVVLSIEIAATSPKSTHGPSVDEDWVGQTSAAAAQAMIAGDQEKALSLYSELHSLVPDSEVYAGFVKTLRQKEAKE